MRNFATNRNRIPAADWLALAVLLLAVAARVAAAWAGRCIVDPDSSVVALMARHMAALQDFPVFFYGQHYMGSLEPLASAFMVHLLGATGFAVNLGPVLFGTAALFFLWRWARDAAGPWGGLAALLAATFGPAVYFQFQTAPRGGYMVALWVETLALFAAARMGARLWEGRPVSAWRFGALGLLAGIGLWSNMIVASALLAAALLLALGMRGRVWRHAGQIAAGGAGALAGLLPWWVHNLRHDWASLGMSQFGARASLAESLRNSWTRFLQLHNADVPFFQPPLALLALVLLGLAAAGAGQAAVRGRTDSPRPNFARLAAVLFCGVYLAVYVVTGFNTTRTARYWVPVVPGLAVLAAAACAAPARRMARAAAWTGLLALTAAQGVLALAAVAIVGRQAEARAVAYRETGAVLERAGVESLLAPIQLYPLNFALGERFAVSNGRQEFHAPIRRAAELDPAPAYASDFNGIEVFLEQLGAVWEAAPVGHRRILWNVRLPAAARRAIPADRIVRLRDDTGSDRRTALTDHDLDTWWPPAPAESAELEWEFSAPQAVHSLELVFAHGHGQVDSVFETPRRIRLEVRIAGAWHAVATNNPVIPLEWSGTRAYAPAGLARVCIPVGGADVEALRLGLLETLVHPARQAWRLAEATAYAPAPEPAPMADEAAVAAAAAWIQAQAPDAVVHAPRWLSGQLLRRGAVPEARLASLPGSVFEPAPGLPRDGTVVPAGPCLFLAEPQSADATRAVLASRNVAFQETPVGAWTGFAVAAAAWPAAPPPALFWTGPGLLAGRRQP